MVGIIHKIILWFNSRRCKICGIVVEKDLMHYAYEHPIGSELHNRRKVRWVCHICYHKQIRYEECDTYDPCYPS